MSGIYGIYSTNAVQDIMSDLTALQKWNRAYGNGDYVKTVAPSFGLGICADHITNAPVNSTPIICKNSYIAVIDAILYNRDELVSRNGVSETLSDEEMLLECILCKGFDILSEVNGDFCGVILNTDNRELTLFRDHMGVRPLFFYRSAKFVGFSSDIRGLIALPEVPATPNPEWVYKAVCGYDTADYTATEVQDIFFVKPASYLTIRPSESEFVFDEHVYWRLGQKKVRLKSETEYAERLRELITESVKRRLDVFPDIIGAELSGGLDSGVIDILINRLGRKAVYYSWSHSPKDLPLVPDDERQVIADICEQENIVCEYGETTMDVGPDSNLGINHAKVGVTIDLKRKAELNYALPPYINTLIICETAQLISKYGGKVVFSGHGGDEGVSHRCDPYEMFYHKEYLQFFKYFWTQNAKQKHRLIKTLKQVRYRALKGINYQKRPFMIDRQAPELLKEEFSCQYQDKKMPVLTFAFDVITYIYSGNTHNRLDVAGLLGAYSGARYIFPYLDYHVIDYAVSIPRHLYLKGNQNRYIFRQAFKDIMPESLYTCTAKNNPSEVNIQRDNTDWYERFLPYKEFLMNSLDRDYWNTFLDFTVLDQWYASGKPSDEEKERYVSIAVKLDACVQLQNMVKVAKSIK